MARRTPYATIRTRGDVPVTRQIPGTVPNSTGGHSFKVENWMRLRRFLILGTEGGSYYASEQKLTKDNADVVFRCIKLDGRRTVDEIVAVSVEGRNAKQAPVLFAFAAVCGAPDLVTRQYALSKLREVCRTGSHLLEWASYIEQFRGWGRGLRNAVSAWYLTPPDDRDVAFQVAKYQNRYGWTHKDLLALAKPQFWFDVEPTRDMVLRWAAGKEPGEAYDSFLQAVDEVRKLDIKSKSDRKRIVSLVEMFNLPWEVLPSEALNVPEIWHGMLPSMGLGALVRNLGRLTANGTITPMSGVENLVMARLTTEGQVKRSRIHPYNVLTAAVTYTQGHGVKGSLRWQPSARITDALNDTFKLAFKNVDPALKNTLIALDVSGSMTWQTVGGSFLTPREASAAMALITAATEPQYAVMAFAHNFIPVNVTANMNVGDVVRAVHRMDFGATDCSLPMKWAATHGVDVDTFVVYTDSETNSGSHPATTLEAYRQHKGRDAKLVVVGMVANEFSIADPDDPGMLDVVGFDSAAPALIADFSAGRV